MFEQVNAPFPLPIHLRFGEFSLARTMSIFLSPLMSPTATPTEIAVSGGEPMDVQAKNPMPSFWHKIAPLVDARATSAPGLESMAAIAAWKMTFADPMPMELQVRPEPLVLRQI